MTEKEALKLVLECAHSYAGEIGFVLPEYATRLYLACHVIDDRYSVDGREWPSE